MLDHPGTFRNFATTVNLTSIKIKILIGQSIKRLFQLCWNAKLVINTQWQIITWPWNRAHSYSIKIKKIANLAIWALFNIKMPPYQYRKSYLFIIISTMGFHILARCRLYIESRPSSQEHQYYNCHGSNQIWHCSAYDINLNFVDDMIWQNPTHFKTEFSH